MSEISVLEIILKGMAIGFLAAAPTGPSGVLVIQRTLNKGRWKGFLTGLGVSISDAVYIMITMMCLSLVLGYLEDPTIALVVKLLGCALLLIFGITTVRNNPLGQKGFPVADYGYRFRGGHCKSSGGVFLHGPVCVLLTSGR